VSEWQVVGADPERLVMAQWAYGSDAYARTVCGLGRSPLLLTAALRAALTSPVRPGREK